jgi:hypothetical protein
MPLQTKAATTGNFMIEAHRFRRVKDHGEACAPDGAPLNEKHT